MSKCPLLLFVLLTLTISHGSAAAADNFQLADGDRVVLIGSTVIEQEQRHGYWETALTSRYPDHNIQFRNLGWSGDTVFGEARAGFGSTADGFKQLKDHVLGLKPTVIFVGYGANESFAGPGGLAPFQKGLNTLLDTLAPARARIVLLSPIRHEDLGRPLPDPAAHNRHIVLYSNVLRETAAARGCVFIDMYSMLDDGAKATPPRPLTTDGIHFNAYGYWRAATALKSALGLRPVPWAIDIDHHVTTSTQGVNLINPPSTMVSWQVTDRVLPASPRPAKSPDEGAANANRRLLRVRGLPPGKYRLLIDNKFIVKAEAGRWSGGISLTSGAEFDQVEQLRRTIVEKNRAYFYRWRPENETYLFGFRKYEQGQNAIEIPQFDPLVARLEGQISKLRRPSMHKYELILEGEEAK